MKFKSIVKKILPYGLGVLGGIFFSPTLAYQNNPPKKIFPQIEEIYLTSCVNNLPCTSESKDVKIEDRVKLNLVLKSIDKKNPVFYSSSKNLIIEGKKIPKSDILDWKFPDSSTSWFKVESEKKDYNNWKGESFKIDRPGYTETFIGHGKMGQIPLDVNPSLKRLNRNDNLGTMRFKARINLEGKIFSTPGLEAVDKMGISKKVHRISVRKDDSFIGWLTSFFNIPYIYGSTGNSKKNHQTDNYVGADCADVIVGAWRKSGENILYTNAVGLKRYTQEIIPQEKINLIGEEFNEDLKQIKYGQRVKTGDIILFGGWHVGILYEDKSDPKGKFKGDSDGIFNIYDTMIHFFPNAPVIDNLVYGDFSIRRKK